MPKGLLAVFGAGTIDLSQFSWFYAVMFLYIVVMAAIHSAMIGAGIIAKEERDKTCEFLFVNPIKRSTVITSKLAAALTNVLFINIISTVTSIAFASYNEANSSTIGKILLLMIGLFLVQVIFLSVGMLAAAVIKKPKLASPIATGMLLGTFFLSMFIKIKEGYEYLKYFTPFHYFDGIVVIRSNELELKYILLSIGIAIVCFAVMYIVYPRRDLNT